MIDQKDRTKILYEMAGNIAAGIMADTAVKLNGGTIDEIALGSAKLALATMAAVDKLMTVESGWLIETTLGGKHVWWAGSWGEGSPGRGWTEEAIEAVRFSRKEDADSVLRYTIRPSLNSNMFVSEHQWGTAAMPSESEKDARIKELEAKADELQDLKKWLEGR